MMSCQWLNEGDLATSELRQSRVKATMALCLVSVGAFWASLTWSTPLQPSAVAAQRMSAALAPAPTRADFAPLFRSRSFTRIERMADARLSVAPQDVVSLVAKSSAIVGAQLHARIDEAIRLAESAVQAAPDDSNAHEALGNALGTKALASGLAGALGSAGKIRAAFQRAVDLNPANHAARFSLLQFYSAAPAMLGGGKAKATELTNRTLERYPEAGKLMQAAMAVADKDRARAESLAMSVQTQSSDDLAGMHRTVMASVGAQYLGEKDFVAAMRIFEELARRYPEHELGVYGQGRVWAAQGQHARALQLFEQALVIYPSALVNYRRAQSLQASGDRIRAVAGYQAALQGRPGLSKSHAEDAKAQLEALRGSSPTG